MQYKDYYKIMGLNREASAEDIKRTYRKLARKYHPDVSKEANAEERFKEIGEAYEVLSDPEKRGTYDQLGSGWQSGQTFTPPPGWQGRGGFGGGGFSQDDAASFSDFFSSLFGGVDMSSGFDPRRRSSRRQIRGEDVRATVIISLEDAYAGTTRTIELSDPTRDRSGYLEEKSRLLKVKIPAGITPGKQIRLAGQGHPSPTGGQSGDLYLEVSIQHHPIFKLENTDIYLTLPIAPWEAALGGTIAVPTLGGAVDLKIPAGSQTGQKLRLKGRGFPGKTPGCQYVTLQIMVPPAKTDAERAFYENMKHTFTFNPREHFYHR